MTALQTIMGNDSQLNSDETLRALPLSKRTPRILNGRLES